MATGAGAGAASLRGREGGELNEREESEDRGEGGGEEDKIPIELSCITKHFKSGETAVTAVSLSTASCFLAPTHKWNKGEEASYSFTLSN